MCIRDSHDTLDGRALLAGHHSTGATPLESRAPTRVEHRVEEHERSEALRGGGGHGEEGIAPC